MVIGMVRPSDQRLSKYGAKIDPDAVRIRFNLQGSMMKDAQVNKQAEITAHQQFVRDTLNAAGINPAFTMPYQACAMELYGLVNKGFAGKCFEDEAKLVLDKWCYRGCNPDVLTAIGTHFGVTWTCPI